MIESFYEETVNIQNEKRAARLYNLFKILSYIFLFSDFVVFGLFIGVYPINYFNILTFLLFIILPMAVFTVSWYVLSKYKQRFYKEYDYTIVTGSLRIGSVIHREKRKREFEIDCASIEMIGKAGSDEYKKLFSSPSVVFKALTPNKVPAEGKGFYYIYFSSSKYGRAVVILECSRLFIAYLAKYVKRTSLEKGL